MDPISQGVLGAALPQCFAKATELRRAAAVGSVAGMAADADILIRSAHDPLLALEFHRHFTHSLLFIPIGALLVALPAYWLMRRQLPWKRVWLYAFLGYATHGLLDACTSYGTQLFWPLSSTRVAWNNVAVVDFFFTLPLGVAVALAFWKKRAIWARWGMAFGLAYLIFGTVQRNRALGQAAVHAIERGHSAQRLTVKPTLGNLWLWRTIYQYDGRFYADAVWVLPGFAPVWYPGGSQAVFDVAQTYPALPPTSRQYRDIQRFQHFSDGYTVLHPKRPNTVGDIRYALLPHQLNPLWGIEIQPAQPDSHVAFENYREIGPDTWSTFGRMLRGAAIR